MEAAFIMIIDRTRLLVEAMWGFVKTSMAEQLSDYACTSAMKHTHSAEESIDLSDTCMGLDDPPSRPFSLKHDILDKDKREKTQRLSNKVESWRASAVEKSEKTFFLDLRLSHLLANTIGCDGQINIQPLNTLNKEVKNIISEKVTVTVDGGPKTSEGRNLEGDSKRCDGGASVNEDRPSEQGTPFQSNVTQNKKGHRCRSAVKPKSINSKRYGCFVLSFLLVCVPLAECVRGNPTHPTSDEDPMPSSLGEEIPLHLDNQIHAVIIETVDDREVNVQHPHNSAEQELGNPAGEPNLHDRMNGDNYVSYQPVEDPENTEFVASRLRQENNRVCQRPDYSIRSFRSLDIASEQCSGDIHGQFTTIERRISSFRKWPSSEKNQSPRQLAAAGFYYEGKSDITTCFYCGIRLAQWEPDDDPLIEHIRTNPECEYVQHLEQNRDVPERPTIRPGDYSTLTTSSVAQDFITMVTPQQCPREHVMNFRIQDIQARENELDGKSTVLRDTESEARQERHGSHNGDSLRRNLTTPSHGLPRDAEAGAERRPGHRQIHPQQESNYRDNTCSGWCPESAIASPDRTMTEEIDVSTRAESRPGHRQIHPQQEMNYLNITHSDWCPESALDVPNLPMPEEIYVSRRDFNTQDERESSTTSSSTLDDEERQALLEQNKRLKECLYCKICLIREAQCLIIPCGHLMCVVCFIRVRNCPFCRGCARAFLCIRRC